MTITAQLQDYQLGETIYEGPETRVRRATHVGSKVPLVAKLPVAAAASLRILGRLAHEAQILAKLAQVQGVVKVHALLQPSGSAVLLLQDPGFASLDRVLEERGSLSVHSALQVGLGLCRVLEGVHAAGVMHKDVKPHEDTRQSRGAGTIPRLDARRRRCHPLTDVRVGGVVPFFAADRAGWHKISKRRLALRAA